MTGRTKRFKAAEKAAIAAMVGGFAAAAYLVAVRPWGLHWGATEAEVAMRLPEDDLVDPANFEATRAVTVAAPPRVVWPWLVQIGQGRAGWYSYDRLDNKGVPSAKEILPEYQHMAVGDVVVMSRSDAGSLGPTVLALREPKMMLWGDPEEPHRFTWLWLLHESHAGETRLVVRIRCQHSIRRSMAGMPGWLFFLLMEIADPIMMRKQLMNLRDRAEDAWGRESA